MLKRFHHWSLKTLGQIRILGTSFVRTAIKVRILPVLSGTAIKIRILPVLYGTAIKVRTRNTAWLTNTRPGKYLLLVQGSAATAALVSISCSWAGSLCTWPTKKVKKWCLTFVRLRLSLFWRLWLLSPALAFVSGSGYCLRLWLLSPAPGSGHGGRRTKWKKKRNVTTHYKLEFYTNEKQIILLNH